MVKIIWTETATEGLQLIHEYISKDSKRYAERLIEKIIERIDLLETFPKSGRVVLRLALRVQKSPLHY